MHSCHSSLSIDTQLKSGPSLGTSCVVSPVITYPDPSESRSGRHRATYPLAVSRLGYSSRIDEDRAGFRFYVLFLSSHAAALTPGSRLVHVPITSQSTMAFAQNVGARRVSRSRRVYPSAPDSPSNMRRG